MENDKYRERTWKGLEAKKIEIGIKIKIEIDENTNRNRRKWK